MRLACLFAIYVCFFGGMQANSALLRGKFASRKLPLPYKYYLMQNNFLNGHGLAAVQNAECRAILCESFWEGVRGNPFLKKGSPEINHPIYLYAITII